ncbi:MAG: hypothetical protein LW625_05380 [Planctomycetaceae bacterium]|nr:hypothetical protein [Planctomycetaceae bacterium]
MRQQRLKQQQAHGQRENGRHEEAAQAEALHRQILGLHRALLLGHGLLQFVDLGVDAVQTPRVGGAEVLAAGDLGHLAQQVFVDGDGLAHHLHAEGRLHGHGCHAARAHADGVQLDAEALAQFGRGGGVDVARVVLAVGQQHQHAALDPLGQFAALFGGITEFLGAKRHAVADRGSIIAGSRLGRRQVLHAREQPLVIQRHGADRVGVAREGDQTHQIVLAASQFTAAIHEAIHDILQRVEPVHRAAFALEIHRQHAARAIHHQLDGHALGQGAGLLVQANWTRDAHHQQRKRQGTHGKGQPAQACRDARTGGPCALHRTEAQRGALAPQSPEAEQGHGQQQQEPWVLEGVGVHRALSWP